MPLLLLLASCVSSELVICDDGRACPTHTVCDLVHETCVDPEQLAACGAAADFATCATAKVPTGRCFDGVCFPAGCGNGFVEPEELCDDGNTVSRWLLVGVHVGRALRGWVRRSKSWRAVR